MNIVITGVSRGIGLELAREALNKNHTVIGICRNLQTAPELQSLLTTFKSNLDIHEMDLTDDYLETKLLNATSSLPHLDLLINNAGIYEHGESKKEFLKSFEVNTYVPFLTTVTLLNKLKAAKVPKVVHITSLMGSIADNSSGGSYAYRASKTALNMVHKCLTIDHPWLKSLVMHPGWVKTRMGGTSAPLSIEDSARGIWKVIDEMEKFPSGAFKNYLGEDLPW